MGKNHWREVEEASSQDVQQWRKESAKSWGRVRGQWGRSPTYMGTQKCNRYELNSRSSGTTATCSGTTAHVHPRGVLAAVLAVLPPEAKTAGHPQTKTSITFASGLRFRCSWARWNRNDEHYKNMQRNIIVQEGRIKPNEERFDLPIREHSVKPPTSKT